MEKEAYINMVVGAMQAQAKLKEEKSMEVAEAYRDMDNLLVVYKFGNKRIYFVDDPSGPFSLFADEDTGFSDGVTFIEDDWDDFEYLMNICTDVMLKE